MRRRWTAGFVGVNLLAVAGCGLSVAQEDELGDQYARSIVAQLPMVTDEAATAELTAMGRRLALVADTQSRDWHFYIVNDTVVNAFAIPGGHIFVYRGLIERAGSYGELAGVVAHEVAHVTLRHSADQLRSRARTGVLVTVFCYLVPVCESAAARMAIDVGGQALFARYSRDDESEADSASVSHLVAAGIDPRSIPALFTRLAEARQRDPSSLESWFATHPQEGDRIARTSALIAAHDSVDLDRLVRVDAGYDRLRARLAGVARTGLPSR
jgi:predicted Zn-dependent protease